MWYIDNLIVTFSTPPESKILGEVWVKNRNEPDSAYQLVASNVIINTNGSISGIKVDGLIEGEIYTVKVQIPGCSTIYMEFNSGTFPTTIPLTTIASTTFVSGTTNPASTTSQATTTLISTTGAPTTEAPTTINIPACSKINFLNVGPTSVQASWTALNNVSYIILLYDNPYAVDALISEMVGHSSSYVFDSLTPNTDYWVQLIPVRNASANLFCGRFNIKTTVSTTADPTTVAATTLAPTTIAATTHITTTVAPTTVPATTTAVPTTLAPTTLATTVATTTAVLTTTVPATTTAAVTTTVPATTTAPITTTSPATTTTVESTYCIDFELQSPTSLRVFHNAIPGATNYEICLYTSEHNAEINLPGSCSSSATNLYGEWFGLTPGATYWFRFKYNIGEDIFEPCDTVSYTMP